MRKRPIPQVPRSSIELGRMAFDSAVKENMEVLLGQRGGLIKTLPETTTVLVAAADAANAAAATATTIAAALPAAAPAGGAGAAAGAWETAALRDDAIKTINECRLVTEELKADFDKMVADVADIRTKYAVAVTLANELKADVNKEVADAIIKINEIINRLQ